jgi:hypothetical protein
VSRPRFNSNQALLLVQKLKLAPKGFTLGVKAEIEKKIFSICPKLLRNAELYGLVISPKMLKVGLKFFPALTPSLKQA